MPPLSSSHASSSILRYYGLPDASSSDFNIEVAQAGAASPDVPASQAAQRCFAKHSHHKDANALRKLGIWIGDHGDLDESVSGPDFNSLMEQCRARGDFEKKYHEYPDDVPQTLRSLRDSRTGESTKLVRCFACQEDGISHKSFQLERMPFKCNGFPMRSIWVYPCRMGDQKVFAIAKLTWSGRGHGNSHRNIWKLYKRGDGYDNEHLLVTVTKERSSFQSSSSARVQSIQGSCRAPELPRQKSIPGASNRAREAQNLDNQNRGDTVWPRRPASPVSTGRLARLRRSSSQHSALELSSEDRFRKHVRTSETRKRLESDAPTRLSRQSGPELRQRRACGDPGRMCQTDCPQVKETQMNTCALPVRLEHKQSSHTISGRLDRAMKAPEVFRRIRIYLEAELQVNYPPVVQCLRISSNQDLDEVFVLTPDEIDVDEHWNEILAQLPPDRLSQPLEIRATTA